LTLPDANPIREIRVLSDLRRIPWNWSASATTTPSIPALSSALRRRKYRTTGSCQFGNRFGCLARESPLARPAAQPAACSPLSQGNSTAHARPFGLKNC
jgi:hypothetical protein